LTPPAIASTGRVASNIQYTVAKSAKLGKSEKMRSLWDDVEAARYEEELGRRLYTSRLLGRDKTLVLHGGGNTSIKAVEQNLFGENQDVLYVKGCSCLDKAAYSPRAGTRV
jgi:rhamnose utilization protein RhaD (predicted bifunctional aldolase and dehydrogenase)